MTDRAWWAQAAIDDTTSAVMAITAGLGSGKTHGFCQWMHERVQQNEGARFSAFMEPTYQKVIDTALPTYQKVLQELGVCEGRHYQLCKSPYPKIVYKYLKPHHEVHFISAETPDKIAGVEYACAVEDEAGINDIEARRNLRTRLYRNSAAKVAQFLLGGAPQGVNSFAEEFDSETLPGWDQSVSRDHTKEDWVEIRGSKVLVRKRRFIVWTDDSPWIAPGYLAQLQDTYGHNPNLIRSYRYGQFCPLTEGAAFSNYMPQKHDCEDLAADPYQPIALTWDFNANPLAWVAVQKRVQRNWDQTIQRWIIIDEANQGYGQLDEACAEFAAKFPVERFSDTPIDIFGDRTGHAASHKIHGSDYEAISKYLRELGYRRVSISAQRQVAPEGASVDAVQRLFAEGLLGVCKRCRMVRKSLMATRWKDGQRKLDKPQGETHTHHGDALKYYCYQELRGARAQPSRAALGLNRQL
jgi:hypothetical protein